MKKMFGLLVLLASLSVQMVHAADAPKIAIVDVRGGVMQSASAKIKMEKLKPEFAKEESELIALKEDLQKMEERLKKDGAVMAADEKRKLEKAYMEKGNEFKFKGQQFQKSSQEEAQAVFKSLMPKFQEALKSIVESEKYDIVLHREAAIFTTPDYDITKAVINKMDAMK